MKVASANVCLDDDTLFVGDECPQCFGHSYYPLRKWLSPLHSFNEIKEVHYAKRNLPIQEIREDSLHVAIGSSPLTAANADAIRKRFFHLYSGVKGTAITGCGVEPSKPWPRTGNNQSGKWVESKSRFKAWGDRLNAGIAKLFKMDNRLLKRGSEMPSEEHNCGDSNPQVLPKNKSKSKNRFSKI